MTTHNKTLKYLPRLTLHFSISFTLLFSRVGARRSVGHCGGMYYSAMATKCSGVVYLGINGKFYVSTGPT